MQPLSIIQEDKVKVKAIPKLDYAITTLGSGGIAPPFFISTLGSRPSRLAASEIDPDAH
jgi:hypothetical protein